MTNPQTATNWPERCDTLCASGPRTERRALDILHATGEADHPALACARCGKCRAIYGDDPMFIQKLQTHMNQLAEWRARIGPAIPRRKAAVPFWQQPDMYEPIWDKAEIATRKSHRAVF